MIFLATPLFNETIPQGVLIIIELEGFKNRKINTFVIKLVKYFTIQIVFTSYKRAHKATLL